MTDPIIDELHRQREEALAEVGFDFHLFCERLRERERASPHVVGPPRRAPKQAAKVGGEGPLRSTSRP